MRAVACDTCSLVGGGQGYFGEEGVASHIPYCVECGVQSYGGGASCGVQNRDS